MNFPKSLTSFELSLRRLSSKVKPSQFKYSSSPLDWPNRINLCDSSIRQSSRSFHSTHLSRNSRLLPGFYLEKRTSWTISISQTFRYVYQCSNSKRRASTASISFCLSIFSVDSRMQLHSNQEQYWSSLLLMQASHLAPLIPTNSGNWTNFPSAIAPSIQLQAWWVVDHRFRLWFGNS